MRILVTVLLVALIMMPTSSQDAPAQVPDNVPLRALPRPNTSIEGESVTLDFFFDAIQQGRVGLMRARGDNIESVSLNAFLESVPFFQVQEGEHWYGLLAIDLEQSPRPYDVSLSVNFSDGTNEQLPFQLNVTNGDFIQQDVILPPDDSLDDLLNQEVEEAELRQIFMLAEPLTPQPLWGEVGFIPPIAGELTSPFGAVRQFNETYGSRHTGWDFNAVIGEPMRASAAGRVAFAGQLPIRGNYVLIDHGRSVYSGYAHLSVTHVTRGQTIAAGQVIGLVGNTGRSSSAHAHVEFIVDGKWVDTADFLLMDLP